MSLIEHQLFGKVDKMDIAMKRLKEFEPPEGYYLAFSGGKDSVCIHRLAQMAGVKFDAHFNLTTVDPPEVVKFTRQFFPDVILEKPEISMWKLIEKKLMPPTRLARYCCEHLKERGGDGRFVVLGVRWAESVRRRNRKMVEHCKKGLGKQYLNPIVDWADADVWEFIRNHSIPYCCLYDEGFTRIGCIMCPMAMSGMTRDKDRFPRHYQMYLKAFGRMLEHRKERGLETYAWKTAQDVMDWWLSNNQGHDKNQQHFQFD